MIALLLVCGFLGFLLQIYRRGHRQAWTDIFVGSIVAVLLSAVAVFETLRFITYPVSKILFRKKLFPPGSGPLKHRRVVVFDGICVLCNKFGAFVHSRLLETGAVDFVPFQDKENEHVNIGAVMKEFNIDPAALQDRICVVSGKKVLWGAAAIIEILQWCKWPYPSASLGLLVPAAFRDALYLTVARNRYEWFGTQPLEDNFAKYLCPYYYINKKAFDKSAKKKKSEGKAKEGEGKSKEKVK